MKHGCFYVVVAESLEYLVEECLAGIGTGVWARIREALPLPNPSDCATIDSQDHLEESDSDESLERIVIKRTSLEFERYPNVHNPTWVTQLTTEAHEGGMNPRRRLPTGNL